MKKIFIIGLAFVLMGLGLYMLVQPKDEPVEPNLEPIQQDIVALDGRLRVVEGETAQFGAISIPDAPYLLQTSLAEPISTVATSMTLNNGTVRGGSILTGYQCFTVDGGKVETEYICGTASGTAITALVRGIDPLNPTATSSAAIYAHRRGADVRTTDFPIVQILKRLNNGQDGFPSPLKYDSSVSTSTLASNDNYLVNYALLAATALQGAPTATTSVPGVVQIGTATQIGASVGMTGLYTLVPPGSLFSSTFRSATTVPVTNASGKLAQGFLNLAEPFTFTATTTMATTSIASLILNGATFSFPTNNATGTLYNNGAGTLEWSTTTPFVVGGTGRSINTTYQNTTGHTLMVVVDVHVGYAAGSCTYQGEADLIVGAATTSWVSVSKASQYGFCTSNSSAGRGIQSMFGVIPPLYYYKASTSLSSTPALSNWTETRIN